mmetsp:Transcript_8026/g.23059  ORF Transcript_8026/g.23059 Transcript_8026/m.23059 type:complete len:208 (+) Transcript_8026:758-1381(+)
MAAHGQRRHQELEHPQGAASGFQRLVGRATSRRPLQDQGLGHRRTRVARRRRGRPGRHGTRTPSRGQQPHAQALAGGNQGRRRGRAESAAARRSRRQPQRRRQLGGQHRSAQPRVIVIARNQDTRQVILQQRRLLRQHERHSIPEEDADEVVTNKHQVIITTQKGRRTHKCRKIRQIEKEDEKATTKGKAATSRTTTIVEKHERVGS